MTLNMVEKMELGGLNTPLKLHILVILIITIQVVIQLDKICNDVECAKSNNYSTGLSICLMLDALHENRLRGWGGKIK